MVCADVSQPLWFQILNCKRVSDWSSLGEMFTYTEDQMEGMVLSHGAWRVHRVAKGSEKKVVGF